MTLPTRPIGRSGLQITTVGFGSWAAGGGGWAFGWGPQDDEASLAAMRHAIDRGVNWIDTAAVYGLGHSEAVVGRLLRDIPASSRPLVFIKCGLAWNDADRTAEPKRDLRPENIRRECGASLRRLGVEAIDLYQFHWPDSTGTPVEDSWGEMLRLVEAGKVRHPAVSNFGVDLLKRFERVRELADDDWRKKTPEFQSPQAEKNVALRDALRPIAERYGATVSAVAVAWTTHWPGVTAAIVGTRSPEQVDGWIGAATLQLTAEDLEELAAAVERTGAGRGPVRSPART